jgi:hypothetical protein
MFIIEDKLVSEDILEKKFVCDLNACKGACCVQGDAGAPLTNDEPGILEEEYDKIKDYLREEGRLAIERDGVYTIDTDGDLVTPLVNEQECAYTIFEQDGTAACGIEKAWKDGKTTFRKPISCHLYPVRVTEMSQYTALNYHTWDICKPACACGESLKVPVYRFLKDALVRAYGEEWYGFLSEAAKAWEAQNFKADEAE